MHFDFNLHQRAQKIQFRFDANLVLALALFTVGLHRRPAEVAAAATKALA